MTDAMTRTAPIEVFLSYARADDKYKEWLRTALGEAARPEIVRLWFDREIPAGDYWEDNIDDHLETAHLIVAVVTQHFMQSKFIQEVEVVRALERNDQDARTFIPLLFETVPLKGSMLAQLNYVPGDPPPIAERRGAERNRAIAHAAEEIIDRAMRLQAQRGRSVPVWNVQPQDSPFVGRTELLETVRRGFWRASAPARCQAIVAPSRLGKSAFAREFAHLHRADYGVIWWIRAERPETRDADFAELAQKLDLPHADQGSAIDAVRRWLANPDSTTRRWLLVFDSAHDVEGVRELLPERLRGDVIITSQYPHWKDLAEQHQLGALEAEEAARYLRRESGDPDRRSAAKLAAVLRGKPKSLMEASRTVKTRRITLAEYLEEHMRNTLRADGARD